MHARPCAGMPRRCGRRSRTSSRRSTSVRASTTLWHSRAAPGLGPHLRWDSAHICAGTRPTSAPGLRGVSAPTRRRRPRAARLWCSASGAGPPPRPSRRRRPPAAPATSHRQLAHSWRRTHVGSVQRQVADSWRPVAAFTAVVALHGGAQQRQVAAAPRVGLRVQARSRHVPRRQPAAATWRDATGRDGCRL